MRYRPRLGLRGQLLVYLLVLSSLGMGVMVYIYNRDLNEALHQKYVEQAILDSTIPNGALVSANTVGDPEALQAAIRTFMISRPQYVKVRVYGTRNRRDQVLASSEPTEIGRRPHAEVSASLHQRRSVAYEEILADQKILETVIPVLAHGTTVASIGLSIPFDPKDALVSHLRARMLSVGPFVIGGFLVIAYLIINRMIVRPVRQLARHAEAVAGGNYRVRLDVRGRDEVAELGRSFNAMCASIAAAQSAVLEKNRELQEAKELFQRAFEDAAVGMALVGVTPGATFLGANPSFARMIGYSIDELRSRTLAHITLPDDVAQYERAIAQLLDGAVPWVRREQQYVHKEGHTFWGFTSLSAVRDPAGRPLYLVAQIEDVTERKRAEDEVHLLQTLTLVISEAKDLHAALAVALRKVCEATGWILGQAWIPSADGARLECSPAWYCGTEGLAAFRALSERLTFSEGLGLPGRVWTSKQSAWIRDVTRDSNFPRAAIAQTVGLKAAIGMPVLADDGVVAVLEFFVFEPRDQDERLIRLVSAVAVQLGAVIRRKRAEEDLAKQAIHDMLTDLYNRRYFHECMDHEVARAERSGSKLAILLADLDRFKLINDTLGHHAGDEVLKAMARSIQTSIREADLVFRWGGDEFVVVFPDATREGVLVAIDRIRRGIQAASREAGLDLDLSIGVALFPEHGRTTDDLVRSADRALYIAKKSGSHVHIGEEEYELNERSFKTVFQPVVQVGSKTLLGDEALSRDLHRSTRILGYEALSRDPEGKLSAADLFHRYQVIGRLGDLKRMCFSAQVKLAQELDLKMVFINVDFDLLDHTDIISKPPGIDLILEISELEALHHIESRLNTARKWRARGFKFAIDDFGAGFISLPFIAQLVPDYIKLERSMILQAVASRKFRHFLHDLLLALQNYVAVGIIAEGIETEKELQITQKLGIRLVQGFLLGKPQELSATPRHSAA